jgi:hypothetical protein
MSMGGIVAFVNGEADQNVAGLANRAGALSFELASSPNCLESPPIGGHECDSARPDVHSHRIETRRERRMAQPFDHARSSSTPLKVGGRHGKEIIHG